ncbi:MAG: hypothetical protein C4308_02830 [Chitinophagaceae bacterium]
MEEKKPISHLMAGAIIAAALIVYSLALYFTGLSTQQTYSYLSYAILIIGLVIFINLYGKALDNFVTFGNLFAYGFKTTAFIIVIMIFFTIIFFLLFPDIKEKMFDVARQQMEERNTPENQIEQAMNLWKRMFWVFTIGGILIAYAILGAIGSLIGAAITKKKPVNPLDQLSV